MLCRACAQCVGWALPVTAWPLAHSHIGCWLTPPTHKRAGQASLFTLSSSNAVVQMLGRSGPRVVSASIDSKRDLEQQLKGHCEAYIMGLTKVGARSGGLNKHEESSCCSWRARGAS
jgi:hypothetical protein